MVPKAECCFLKRGSKRCARMRGQRSNRRARFRGVPCERPAILAHHTPRRRGRTSSCAADREDAIPPFGIAVIAIHGASHRAPTRRRGQDGREPELQSDFTKHYARVDPAKSEGVAQRAIDLLFPWLIGYYIEITGWVRCLVVERRWHEIMLHR
jgi:hypothetical protein